MANTKQYSIKINGLTESISAVESLNKQLDKLEQRMNTLSSAKVSTGGGSAASRGNASALSEEERVQKEINKLKEQGAQLDAKIKATQDEIYKRVDATKQLYKETVADQKALAAAERLQADAYSNTMVGMKQQLADIKAVIQTTDLGDSDSIKKMTEQANELTNKLKEMEEAYGQFGRNVGNYKSALDGIGKVSLNIGGVTREFNNAREATRTLNNELKTMAANGQQDTEAFKQLRQAVMELESNINDAKKPMDNLMDTMESFVALSQTTNGLSAFFGFDNSEIQRSIQKLVGLQNAMQGIQKIQRQIQTREGIGRIFLAGSQNIDRFVAKITGAKVGMDGLTMSSRAATTAVRGLSLALKSIGVGVIIYGITMLVDAVSKLGNEMDSSEKSANRLDESLKALNKSYSDRRDLITSSYISGGISNEELLTRQYDLQTSYIAEQINLLRERMSIMNEQSGLFSNLGWYFDDSTSNYRGGRMNGSVTVESYNSITSFYDPTLKIAVNNIEELEEAWRKCNEAILDGKDYFSKWGEGFGDWFNSLFATVSDTERAMRELGKVRIGDFISEFGEINENFNKGKITAEQFAEELSKLKGELNDNEVLRSVIVNLDKYIPDEKVREAINNIINEIVRLDDSFNMTSPEQVRHWMQVRIDGMKEGVDKIKAQLEADEKYEIAQYGNTQEQIDLIRAKYARKREEQLKRYNEQEKSNAKKHAKELETVERELNSLRIELMKEGLDKQIAQLEEERRQKIQAVKDNGIRVGELTKAINDVYDKRIVDAKKEWARQVEQVYVDMWNKIYQLNHQNTQLNFDNQMKEIEENYQKLQDMLARDFKGVGIGYSDKNVSLEKKAKKGNEGSEDPNDYKYKVLVEKDEAYTMRLEEEFAKRTEARKKYYAENEKLAIDEENKLYAIQTARTNENLSTELRNLQNSYKKEDDELKKHLENGKITQQQYNEAVKRLAEERRINEAQIADKYHLEAEQKESEHEERLANIKKKSDDEILENYRDFISKLSNIDTSRAVTDGVGFISVSATKRRNNQLISLYSQLRTSIEGEITKLEAKLKTTDLTKKQKEAIEKLINQYREMAAQLGIAIGGIQQDTEDVLQKKIAEVTQYIQAVAQSFQDIMSAVWDAQDIQFDKEQEQLDKENELLDKKLDEQQEIVDRHKSAIDAIEDELSTARGDRRQHLIDQLNAEMAAQRAALKQEQKIQKEKDAAQKKQDELEKKRKKAQYQRDLLQAIVNGAMAVTYAAMNSWPIPAIPMMALAATTTAAQIAIMSSNKPYAKGGQLDGPSHREGGIKVPGIGGGIELEGQEYVIRKKSTAKNLDILDYINRSERKLSLDDFIDFYGGKVKKNVKSMSPGRKFADGGALPTLSNTYDFDDRLISAFEEYSNRQVVVSVVDINNRQAAVRNVQVLAGVENS